MFKIDTDKNIEINRGDKAVIKLINKNGLFYVGDKLKFTIVEKNDYNNIIFQKEYEVTEDSDTAYITLSSSDTRIGDVISEKKEFWYEIDYNDEQTIVGYDDNKAKKFILYPEAPTKGSD